MTIVVPCRNERPFIDRCLRSIIDSDYPHEALQVLVVDGMSDDGTREAVERLQQEYPWIQLRENRRLIAAVALNIGVREAHGEFILWMSSHNTYPRNYIRECIVWSRRMGADNVGGCIDTVPRNPGFLGDAIAAALTHRFGVGGSSFRLASPKPRWVDTNFGGCYRRDVFDRVGLFNERLARGQDMEFNLRLRRAGGRTLLVPTIRSTYFARTRPLEFLRHNWTNGLWAILPFRYCDVVPVAARHLVPLAFVAALLGTTAAAALSVGLRSLPFVVLVPYLAAALTAAVQVAWRRRDMRFVVAMPIVFASLHLSYGFGSLWGVVRSTGPLLRAIARRSPRG